jgi:uncharacterized membrane protein
LLAFGRLIGKFTDATAVEEAVALAVASVLSAGLMLVWPPVAASATDRTSLSWAPFFVINILLFVGAIRLIYLGVERLQPRFVHYGLFLFFVLVIGRYFELFGTLLNTGLLFITGGAVLLALGYGLSRQRARPMRITVAGASVRDPR